jgi:phage shock protein C
MICSSCTREIPETSSFCSYCGVRQRSATFGKRLTRSATDSKIAGVCGGIAEYLDVDPTLVRVIWATLSVVPGCIGGGVLAYILAWFIMPKSSTAPASGTASLEHAAK